MTLNHQFLICIFLILLCLKHVKTDTCNNFDQFKILCKRLYSTDEEALRKIIYEAKCKSINQFNQLKSKTYQKAINCFTGDRLQNEPPYNLALFPLKTTAIKQNLSILEPDQGAVSTPTPPSSYNMVTLGYVTSVRNQGSCGSCWCFAATGLYQADLRMRGYLSYELSDQGALECTNNYAPDRRASNCAGGYFEDALLYYATVGGILRSNWPYISAWYGSGSGFQISKGICNEVNRIYIGKGIVYVYGGNPGLTNIQIKYLLINKGPLVIGVYANRNFMDYGGSIYQDCPAFSAEVINHAILLVGYDDSTNSWLAKNQWGTGWGQDGYIRISYDHNCGLSSILANIQFTEQSANPEISFANNSLLITQEYLEETYIIQYMALGLLLLAF